MSKLSAGCEGTVPNEYIIKLLHDEVVSLCQRTYSAVSGLEIDGIICISILDTKEQQVVKIHKTLKSVFADTKKRNKKLKTCPTWLQGTLGNRGLPQESAEQGPENLQNDISALSNLLRETNAAIDKELSKGETVSKASKRKRKQPQQRVAKNVGVIGNEPSTENNNTEEKREANKTPLALPEGGDFQGSPGVNPFIHKDVIKVKEEKIDHGYDEAEQPQPKIVHVASISETDKDKTETNNVGVERQKVSSLIESIIEKEIPREKESPDKNEDSQQGAFAENEAKDTTNENNGENTEFQAVEVKVEKTSDDSEYDNSQDGDQADFTKSGSDYFGTGGSNSETENFECPPNWLYGDRSSQGEVGRVALLDKLYEKGSLSHIGYPRERGREERDPLGRSWIEMVKDNVNKYQAALERSGRGKSESEVATTVTSSNNQASRGHTSLVALLKQPGPVSLKSKELTTNAILDSAPCSRGPSVPKQVADQISERRKSSSPIIKIEVDEDLTNEMYSQSNGEVTSHPTDKKSGSGEPEDIGSLSAKAPQGKLESRYPALFSHLQQAKQSRLHDSQDQSDSLVNRLPFISFQELFSQAATGAPSPRLSESTTMQLLAQARINPYPSKEKVKAPRKVWNWKKRQVRPKDADGKIISPIPIRVKSPDSVRKKRFIGLPTSMKKTFSKRGQKSGEEDDRDWQPDADNADVDSDNNSQSNTEAAGTSGRRTRLSCGEKPRINFAELENSDIEMEEDDMETTEMYQGSRREILIDNINPLLYTERLEEDNSAFPGGGSEQLLAGFSTSSEQLNSASGAATDQYKCSLCGLEFNQEYRWHYHLIKVHGITEEKVQLFR